jgi:hypothetical protein
MSERQHRELAPQLKLEGEPPPLHTSLRSPLTPETLLGEFIVSHYPRRTKPHRETGSVAAAPLAPVRSGMAPPCWLIRVAATLLSVVSRSFHHVREGLDQGYPSVYIKS